MLERLLFAQARRELLSPPEDVWAFLAEPHHLSDWWPNLAAVEPDRRGLAPQARWKVRRGSLPGLLRRPSAEETVVIRAVDPGRRLAWQFTQERLDVEIALEPAGHDHTIATLTVSGPFLLGFRRSLPRVALDRLHSLIQTAASF